ncbi:hypothetical protein TNCV_4164331 [Trichonephila clavipes]|nr:hypothetical protein TNCV_4164331 [Trichonephila clavipes]
MGYTAMLIRTVSSYSTPNCPTALEIRDPIPQSASVSVIGWSMQSCLKASPQSIPCMFYGIDQSVQQFLSILEQTHMGKDHFLTIAISDYRTSVGNVELNPSVQHNASPDDNSRTTLTVSDETVFPSLSKSTGIENRL